MIYESNNCFIDWILMAAKTKHQKAIYERVKYLTSAPFPIPGKGQFHKSGIPGKHDLSVEPPAHLKEFSIKLSSLTKMGHFASIRASKYKHSYIASIRWDEV